MNHPAPHTPNLNVLITRATGCNFEGTKDRAGRWWPAGTIACGYCAGRFRPPSRAWPNSYRKGLSTIKANEALHVITAAEATIVRSGTRLKRRWGRNVNDRSACAEKLLQLEAKLPQRTNANTDSLVCS